MCARGKHRCSEQQRRCKINSSFFSLVDAFYF
ncbi:helix-loop-helix domain-containing protein [Lysinibacillus sp. JNUCC-52]|nr:helix-loop-helix domain-containing protein [Lysinibacillus sp. JNUCC-52]